VGQEEDVKKKRERNYLGNCRREKRRGKIGNRIDDDDEIVRL